MAVAEREHAVPEVPDAAPVGGTPAAPSPPPKAPSASLLVELPILIVLAALIAFLLRTFIAQAFYIPSGSMIPQLQINDRVVVSKLSYHLHNPRRGDIVVFACPPRADCSNRTGPTNPIAHGARFVGEKVGIVQPSTDDYIKRVIALPGETVEGRGGHVYINGHLLIEPYLRATVVTSDFTARTIAPGRLWVMGDNRSNSADSRVFGPIERRTVVGRTVGRVWPVPHASFL